MGFILLMSCTGAQDEVTKEEAKAPVEQLEHSIDNRSLKAPDNTQIVLPQSPPKQEDISVAVDWGAYPFLNTTEGVLSLEEQFQVPEGYARVDVKDKSFGQWLRGLPVLDRQQVFSYRGEAIRSAPAIAVVPMSVGRGDIQQCADSILRLYSEYLWSKGLAEEWGIHFTSGDLSAWKAWKNGQRFRVEGRTVNRIQSGTKDGSYEQYQKWMHHAFIYAGTQSLHLDSEAVPLTESIEPGDFFVSPGAPGHAVIVLDVAISEGRPPVALLGQGFMPAQEFHVLTDNGSHMLGHWFELPMDKGEFLSNPSYYGIPREGVYRF